MKHRKGKRKRKMTPAIKRYLAALKRRKGLGPIDREEHAAIRRYHGV